jgi:adenylate cyclase
MPASGGDRETFGQAISARVREEVLRSLSGSKRLPEGVVTILFTDVEGATGLVKDLGDEDARALLRKHDETVRRTIELHHGTEVERAGDSFMVAFVSPRHAVACALEIQLALSDPAVRVRIGMDTGEVITEEKGYFGKTVFRASRIAQLARGGQILASEATKVLAEPAGFAFADLGEQELKGLGDGHRLFEVRPGDEAKPA